MQIMTQKVWGGAQNDEFLTSSQEIADYCFIDHMSSKVLDGKTALGIKNKSPQAQIWDKFPLSLCLIGMNWAAYFNHSYIIFWTKIGHVDLRRYKKSQCWLKLGKQDLPWSHGPTAQTLSSEPVRARLLPFWQLSCSHNLHSVRDCNSVGTVAGLDREGNRQSWAVSLDP